MLTALVIASAIATALIGGVFFAFSVFVMRALAEQPSAQGVAAMQRINVTVIHLLFLGPFLGAVPLLAAAAVVAWAAGQMLAAGWLIGALIVYTLGSVAVTLRCNVPRNDRLAALQASSTEAAAYWPVYVREWLLWNHLRCAASLVAAAAAAAFALTIRR